VPAGSPHRTIETRPADPEIEVLIEYRRAVMRASSGHVAALAAIVVDGAPYPERTRVHTQALLGILDQLPALFPHGSSHADSEARPEIWQRFPDFEGRAAANYQRVEEFRAAVHGGDAGEMARAFVAVGTSCRACHADFRL
jgi:cytochrome c556